MRKEAEKDNGSMVRRVLVATDRSETAEVAVRFAAEMATRFGADLVPLFSGGYLCRRCFRRRRLAGPACPSPQHRHLPVQVPPG